MVVIERPRVTRNIYVIALQPPSSRKCSLPKDDMTSGINLNVMVKTLTKVSFMKIGATGVVRCDLLKHVNQHDTKTSKLPRYPIHS